MYFLCKEGYFVNGYFEFYLKNGNIEQFDWTDLLRLNFVIYTINTNIEYWRIG